jgi:hypothetical protein
VFIDCLAVGGVEMDAAVNIKASTVRSTDRIDGIVAAVAPGIVNHNLLASSGLAS